MKPDNGTITLRIPLESHTMHKRVEMVIDWLGLHGQSHFLLEAMNFGLFTLSQYDAGHRLELWRPTLSRRAGGVGRVYHRNTAAQPLRRRDLEVKPIRTTGRTPHMLMHFCLDGEAMLEPLELARLTLRVGSADEVMLSFVHHYLGVMECLRRKHRLVVHAGRRRNVQLMNDDGRLLPVRLPCLMLKKLKELAVVDGRLDLSIYA